MASVLIVDDSVADQYYISELIEEYNDGIETHSAHDGQEALDYVASTNRGPDLIFLDLNMPGMNGFEFLEEYERNGVQHCPVIVLSSSEQPLDKDKASRYKFVTKFLVKPISFDDLASIETIQK